MRPCVLRLVNAARRYAHAQAPRAPDVTAELVAAKAAAAALEEKERALVSAASTALAFPDRQPAIDMLLAAIALTDEPSDAPSFAMRADTSARGCTVTVTTAMNPSKNWTFSGPDERVATKRAQAFIDEELAKHHRREWGKGRRRAGRRRQAAFRAAEKAQAP